MALAMEARRLLIARGLFNQVEEFIFLSSRSILFIATKQ